MFPAESGALSVCSTSTALLQLFKLGAQRRHSLLRLTFVSGSHVALVVEAPWERSARGSG
jgi:hypothetical protein